MAGDNIDDLVRCLAKVWPCWANLYFDGAMGKRAWPEVMVVRRWPMRTESGRSLSYHSFITGL